ncbi:MAG: 50S ribosomal protein L22 [Candidatus Babeliales bacterium]
MVFKAVARWVKVSPYKLRRFADVVRGKNVDEALHWLDQKAFGIRRTEPLRKTIVSAAANAKHLKGLDAEGLFIKELRVDQGPIFKYYKPGAMGRGNVYRKRLSHIEVIVESTAVHLKKD